MSRRPALFTEASLKRAAKVAKSQGMAVRVLRDGSIMLVETQKVVDESAVDMGQQREIVL